MTDARFFRGACFSLMILAVGISGYYRSRADRHGGKLPSRPTGRVADPVRAAFGVIALAAFWVAFASPPWAAGLSFPMPVAFRWVGLVVVAAMVPLVWWTVWSIGTNISPTTSTRAGAQLVTSGPYRWIRHPLYTSGVGLFAGTAVVLGSWIIVAILAGLAAFLPQRVRQEETQLIASFGDQYRRYSARTGRFLPRFGAHRLETNSWKSN